MKKERHTYRKKQAPSCIYTTDSCDGGNKQSHAHIYPKHNVDKYLEKTLTNKIIVNSAEVD